MPPDLPLTLFVDRACPLCAREIRWLERTANPARLLLVDVSATDFSCAGLGKDLSQLRRRLHARSASGVWLTGVEPPTGAGASPDTAHGPRPWAGNRCGRCCGWPTRCLPHSDRTWSGYRIPRAPAVAVRNARSGKNRRPPEVQSSA